MNKLWVKSSKTLNPLGPERKKTIDHYPARRKRVPMDANEYETMQQKMELLAEVQTSLNQLENGLGLDHEDATKIILQRVLK